MLWDEPKIFFLERRYFFSIILSEFLKNRVALQHLRDDYSYIDNENWQVRQLAELINGEDKLSKKAPVVTKIPLRKAEKIDYESFILEEDLGMKNMEET